MITYDEFTRLDLRVVTIHAAERVEGSEKLLRLSVSMGDEERCIVAGIGKSYAPDELIARQVVIIANLEPRSLMGIQSQGMLLAAGDDPVFLTPEQAVSPGSKIR